MDQHEREQAWTALRRESDARGRAIRKEFEALLRKTVTAALKPHGFKKVAGGLRWQRQADHGRIDAFSLEYDRGNRHPEALRYQGSFETRIEAVEAAKGAAAPDPAKYVDGTRFPLPDRSTFQHRAVTYEVNDDVPFADVCARFVDDATAAMAVLDGLDVTSLDSVLAWFDGDPGNQAFAHAAFGDLDAARATYPRRHARTYDTETWPDRSAERLGLDPEPIPPEGGFVDEQPICAAVREAFGSRIKWVRGTGDDFEITIAGPVTEEDRAVAAPLVPTEIRWNVTSNPDDDLMGNVRLMRVLGPVLVQRERAVPDLIAVAKSAGPSAVMIEVDQLDDETERLIREIVPESRIQWAPVRDLVAGRLDKRDRLRAADEGISDHDPISPEMERLIEYIGSSGTAD